MKFLYIKGSDADDVRLSKFIRGLAQCGHQVDFWGWKRLPSKAIEEDNGLTRCRYLFRGGGYGRNVMWKYPRWMWRVFCAALTTRGLEDTHVIAVNFDAALPVALAFLIRRRRYVYEVYDEIAISYRFPWIVKRLIRVVDHFLMRHAQFVIHVDRNRLTYDCGNSVVIENAPEDYWHGKARNYDSMKGRVFAVTGNLSACRGLDSICTFACMHPDVKILMVGTFFDDKTRSRALSLPNVEFLGQMSQTNLFALMESCCAVFSLYDPELEINRQAASNKMYDAMMMGIPVITNKEVANASFVRTNGIGLVVDYDYNKTWDDLVNPAFLHEALTMGRKGRKIYLERYQFAMMLKTRFLPLFCA